MRSGHFPIGTLPVHLVNIQSSWAYGVKYFIMYFMCTFFLCACDIYTQRERDTGTVCIFFCTFIRSFASFFGCCCCLVHLCECSFLLSLRFRPHICTITHIIFSFAIIIYFIFSFTPLFFSILFVI